MARLTIPLLLALLPLAPLHAQSEITEARLRAHIETLASDAYEGREPGTRGEAMAAEYIARRLAEYGLAPAFGDYGYYQPIGLVERLPTSAEIGWEHDGERISIAADDIVLIGQSPVTVVEARMIFGGYGEDLDEEGAGRLGEMDLEGTAVFLFVELPEGMEGASFSERRERLGRRGAAAVIGLLAPNDNWAAIAPAARERGLEETATMLGRSIDPDDEANAFIERQDGWALTQAGIPSIMAGGSFSDLALLGAFLGGPYHDASDDLSRPIELGGAAEDANLHVALVLALADPARYPNPRGGQDQ